MKNLVFPAIFAVSIMPALLNAAETQVTEAVVKAPPAEVWKAFSTAEGYKKLGVAKCDMELKVGGVIRSHYNPKGELGDEGTIHNEILSFENERMLSIRIKQPPKGFPFAKETYEGTWSVISLTDLGSGRTHVRIAGMGYPETDEGKKMKQFFESGNGWVLSKLQTAFDADAAEPTRAPHAADPLAPISLERVIELPRGEVWQHFSTSAGWKKLMRADSRIEPQPGGKFELYFNPAAPEGERGSEGCKVLSVVPNELLSFEWNAPPKFVHARQKRTWVVVQLDELTPARTRVRLRHLGFAELAAANAEHKPEWQEVRAYFEQAWNKVLDAAKAQDGKQG